MSGKKPEFSLLENLARSNQWPEIENIISHTNRNFFLEQDILKLATLARRAWRLSFASYLLQPLVLDPDFQVKKEAPVAIVAEFAVIQLMMGGRTQALNLLKGLPKNDLTTSFAWVTYYFSTSEYTKAIPWLLLNMQNEADPYKQSVAELNLCACLNSAGEYEEALHRLERLQNYFKKNDFHLLFANSLELKGQIYIHQHQWDQANQLLEEASRTMGSQNKLYSLFIDKWLLICQIQKNRVDQSKIINFMGRADKLHHHQSKRDLLFYWSYFYKNEDIIQKLYFGTPFYSYRQFMKNEWGPNFNGNSLPWNGNFFEHQWRKELKIQSQATKQLKLSSQEQKLLTALLKDFIEPFSITALFYEIYPDLYYDHHFSRAKTYKVIQRLNKKFKEHRVSLKVLNKNHHYRLQLEDGWMINKRNPDQKFKSENESDQSLLQMLSQSPRTRTEVMSEFRLSRSSCLRWLKKLQEEGQVEKIGQGPGSFYRLTS